MIDELTCTTAMTSPQTRAVGMGSAWAAIVRVLVQLPYQRLFSVLILTKSIDDARICGKH